MAVRPYITSGVVLASAGLIVASAPTIVAPLTQHDIKVTADTETALTALSSGLDPAALAEGASLISAIDPEFLTGLSNAWFSGLPTDSISTNGWVGVYDYLVGDSLPLTTAFVDGNLSGLLSYIFPDTEYPAINAFVTSGIPAAIATQLPDDSLASVFLTDNVQGVANALVTEDDAPALNAWINGGPNNALATFIPDNTITYGFLTGNVSGALSVIFPDEESAANKFVNGDLAGAIGTAPAIQENELANSFFNGYTTGGETGPNGILGATNWTVNHVIQQTIGASESEAPEESTLKVSSTPTEEKTPATPLVRNSFKATPKEVLPFGLGSGGGGGVGDNGLNKFNIGNLVKGSSGE